MQTRHAQRSSTIRLLPEIRRFVKTHRGLMIILLGLLPFSSSAQAQNHPPDQPQLVYPPANTNNIGSIAPLEVLVSDADSDPLKVTFFGRRIGSASDFTLAVFGDTQNYYSVYQTSGVDYFTAQAKWVALNHVAKKIEYVAQMGDVVNNNVDAEWVFGSNAMTPLEDTSTTGLPFGVPFGVAVGNHDERNGTTVPYNTYFGWNRYANRPYYGGHYGTANNNNYYELFSAAGVDFIVIYLEYGIHSEPSVLSWANQLLKQYITRRGIVVSHQLLEPGSPAPWGSNGDGLAVYNALKENPNLFLMLCGHNGADYKRSDVYNGNTVHTLMEDYSGDPNGGNSYIRLLNISPAINNIRATTYSPTAGTRKASPVWDLPFNGFPVVGMAGASGSDAVQRWTDLASCAQYEWYVTVSDGQTTTTGPTWVFSTAGCSISGSVKDQLGVGIPGATVAYSGGSTTTDSAGNYMLSGVGPGTYSVTASAAGYQVASQTVTVTSSGTGIADFTLASATPVLTLSPASMIFGAQLVGTTSTVQSVTLRNAGSIPIAISSVNIAGDFAQTSHCGSSLQANSSCTVDLAFSPKASGTRAGTLTVTAGSPSTLLATILTGTAIAPAVNLSPASLSFGDQTLNTTSSGQTVTLTNNGTAPLSISTISLADTTTYRFASWSDAEDHGAYLYATSNRLATLNPTFNIFNGGFSNLGVTLSPASNLDSMQSMSNAMRGNPGGIGSSDNGMFSKSFLARGNHDNANSNPTDWQAFFASYPEAQGSMLDRVIRVGGINYAYMAGQDSLTYSFDYGNARFVMLDVPGSSDLLTENQISWIDQRLTDAEANHPELAHAFLGFHGPLYCVASPSHCSCPAQRASCTSSSAKPLIDVINRHPIVTALFNGYEHNLGWTHLDSTRIGTLTHPIEQFMTAPSGSGTYNTDVQFDPNGVPYRFDYVETSIEDQAFGIVDVNGLSYTVSLYREGTESPVWTHTFTKAGTAKAYFAQTNNCGSSLSIGGSCTINVTFSPGASGKQTAALTIIDSASGSPHTVNMTGNGVAAGLNLSPSTLTFANQLLNTTSSAQSVMLTNSGTASLTISSITVSGDYAQTNNCGATLGSGITCAISVTFTPTATGSRSGTVIIADNAAGSPHTVNLSGTGVTATVSLSPASLTFSNQALNSTSDPQAVTLTNSGTASVTISSITPIGDFAQTNTCGGTLTTGSNCTISVTFTPTATGSRTGDITIADDATGNPHRVALAGTGVAAGVSLSPASLTFAGQLVSTTSAAQTVTLTNTGAASLTISNITSSGDFAQTNNCGTTLSAGNNCTINVTFTPTATGSRSGSVLITDSASGGPHTISLSGSGLAPGVNLSPSTLTFANQFINTRSAAQPVILTNSGGAGLAISSVTTSGDFAQTNDCGTSLGAGSSCTISVTFTPTATGNRAGLLTVADDASGNPHSVALAGTGVVSGVSLSPSVLTFASQLVNTSSAAQAVTLTSSGTASLAISNILASGDFAQTNNCGTSVASGSSCTISITFTPTARGSRNGAVTITDNASGSPHTVDMSGTGVAAGVSLSPSIVDFNNQPVNMTSPAQTVTLTSSGDAGLAISSITTSGDFAQTNNCGSTIAPAAGCSINVTFTPKGTGTRTGMLIVTDNAVGSPHSVSLTGTGTAAGVSLSPPNLAFGTELLNMTSTPQVITVTNSGNANLAISSISASGDFSQTNLCSSSLAPGASCTITVTFTPTATGSRTGTVTMIDDALGSPQVISLTGTGVAPGASLSPSSLSFAGQLLNMTSSAQTVTLTNSGTATLIISSIATTGDFGQTDVCGSTLAPGANCTISVRFTPIAAGSRTGTLIVTDNATGSPQSVSLIGTGVAPAPVVNSITPNSIRIGATVTVTITGANFSSGASLTFVNGTGNTPTISNLKVISPTSIQATLTAKVGPPKKNRVWDVVVTNPDGSRGQLRRGLTVIY